MSRLARILRSGVVLGPAAYFAIVTYIIVGRIAYPFQLEWMEGGSLQHVLRLQDGLPLYVRPSLEFTPYLYPPFYYYVSLGLAGLTGLTWFWPLRLTSVLASIGCTASVLLIVRRHTGSVYWGLLSAGLFVATFRLGGAWFDIARVDMLFVALLLAAQVIILSRPRGEAWAGLLLGLAFYCKQTTATVAIPLLAAVSWRRGAKAGLRAALVCALVVALTTAVEDWRSGGWYSYYIFDLPGKHGLDKPFLDHLRLRWQKVFHPLAVATAFGILHATFGRRAAWKGDTGLTAVFVLGMLGLAIGAGLNRGSYDNVNVPAFAALAIVFGIAGCWLERQAVAPGTQLALWLTCAVQFVVLGFEPRAQIPKPEDLAAGKDLVRRLGEAPLDVLIPSHAYLAKAAGKRSYAHQIALQEIQGAYSPDGFQPDPELAQVLRQDLAKRRFSLIVLDDKHPFWCPVFKLYRPQPLPYAHAETFFPVTGKHTRPETLWTLP